MEGVKGVTESSRNRARAAIKLGLMVKDVIGKIVGKNVEIEDVERRSEKVTVL